MEKINDILSMLGDGTNFSLVRFNDGEMSGIEQVGCTVARGDQYVDKKLSDKLREAITYRDDNYWIGVPCGICWPRHRKVADELVPKDYKFRTLAVVTTNRNWELFVQQFNNIAVSRKIVWVSGSDQDITKLAFTDNIVSQVCLPLKNSFCEYDNIMHDKLVDTFPSGSIIVLSCGPLSRVLAYEWWKHRKDCTYLDVGSAFDPFTRNVWHRCHKGELPPCKECN
jgi:hypothetical protein